MRQVAERSGYSPATVSRALAGSPKITIAARRAILQAVRECGYRDECRAIALIVPDFSFSNYFGLLLERLYRECARHGFAPAILSNTQLQLIEEQHFCGAISVMSLDGLERYWGSRHSLPLVCINTSPRHLDGIFTVGSNDEQGMQLAVRHLLELGHRRIGRIGGLYSFYTPANWNSSNRDRVFRKLMSERGLPDDLFVVAGAPSGNLVESVKSLLARGCTALLSLDEGQELELMHVLRILDCRVPEDLSLIGWSHASVASHLEPALTSLEQNFEELVFRAVELFRQRLEGVPGGEDLLVDYHFVPRASTAPPPR